MPGVPALTPSTGAASAVSTRFERFDRYAPYAVFAVALVVRLAYMLQIERSPLFAFPVVDARSYAEQAARLAAGDWLGRGQGPFWQPPFYPYFLGVVRAIFPEGFFRAARIAQALLGSATCALAYLLGRRFFGAKEGGEDGAHQGGNAEAGRESGDRTGRVVGLAAGLAAAFYGPLLFFDGELLPASLATVLDMAGLVLVLRAIEVPTPRRFAAAGAVFGAAALTVPTVLTFVGAAALWIVLTLRRRGDAWPHALARAGTFAATVALVIAPVTLRNALVGRDRVLISYNAGVNFYLGNHSDYPHTIHIRPGWEWDDVVGLPVAAGVTRPSAQSRYFFSRAWTFVRGNPRAYLVLLARKTAEFWRGVEVGRNQPIYFWRRYSPLLAATLWKRGIAFPFGVVAPLALVGIALALRRRDAVLGIGFVAIYGASVIAFFPGARYRIPVVPVLLVFAAYAGVRIHRGWRARRTGTWAPAAAAVAVLLVACNVRTPPMDMEGNADVHYNLGNAYARAGRYRAAMREFGRAVELDPGYWEAWLNLGSTRAVLGDAAAARKIFRKVLAAEPRRPEAWLDMAQAWAVGQQPDSARAAYRRALELDPTRRDAYVELIRLYVQRREYDRAEALLERARQVLPADADLLRRFYEELIRRQGGAPAR